MDFDENMQEEEEIQAPDESKVGKKLSDLTTRRVIILVLSMMFSVPFLALNSYRNENDSYTFGLEYIDIYSPNSSQMNFTRLSYIEEHSYSSPLFYEFKIPLVSLSVYSVNWQKEDFDLTTLRGNEYILATAGEDTNLAAIFDKRSLTKLDAGLGICRTIFICIILTGGALFFTKDTNDLVIIPIDKMLDKVKKIAKNPLEAAQEEEREAS